MERSPRDQPPVLSNWFAKLAQLEPWDGAAQDPPFALHRADKPVSCLKRDRWSRLANIPSDYVIRRFIAPRSGPIQFGWSRTAGGNATSSPRAAIPAGGAAWNDSNSKINFNGSIRRLNGGEGDSGAYSVHGHADAGEFGSRGSGSALVPNLLVRDGSGLIKTGAGTRSIAAGNAHAGTTTTNGGTFAVPSLAIGRTASNLGQIASAPFVYSVTSSGDTGAGSGLSGDLRYCITQANLNSGSTVSFADLAGTTVVTLTGALPIITTSMTFAGLQSNTFTSPVTIDGGGLYRGFFVDAGAGAAVTFNFVQFQNTRAQGGAGGAGGGGGGAGMGSAIFVNSGAVTVNAATFAGGVTNGGAGGIGRVTTGVATPDGGGGGGGGRSQRRNRGGSECRWRGRRRSLWPGRRFVSGRRWRWWGDG